MAIGTTLAEVVEMVKGELWTDLDSAVSPGGDALLRTQCNTMQKWLALQRTWPHLRYYATVAVSAGNRYCDLPSTLELARTFTVSCRWSNLWYGVENGITLAHYNALDPEQDQREDPVSRWALVRDASGVNKLEVWPLPDSSGILRVEGQARLSAFLEDDDVCTLDDLLIAQFTAAKLATRFKQADAPALVAQARDTLRQLTAGYPQEDTLISTLGRRERGCGLKPTVAVMHTTVITQTPQPGSGGIMGPDGAVPYGPDGPIGGPGF